MAHTTDRVPRVPLSRVSVADVVRHGLAGVRVRPLRTILSALGITIGIAAMVAVLGIAASSQERLSQQLATLGTNLLTAGPGRDGFGGTATLDRQASGRVGLMADVESVAAVGYVPGDVFRSALIDRDDNGGLSIYAADESLLDVISAGVVEGRWLPASPPDLPDLPAVVLGSQAARHLGVLRAGTLVEIDDQLVTVVGILAPLPLAPEFDSAALMTWGTAERFTGEPQSPTRLYLRADPDAVLTVRDRVALVIAPQAPGTIEVSRPSDALKAIDAANSAFTGLLAGLGGIALLVGGVGVANTMIISVIERRREIGLRRALGARRRHIRDQFFVESIVLSLIGGVAGAVVGSAITVVVAAVNGWPSALPPLVLAVALGATVAIGAVAGWYPAMRAARISPTSALSSV